MIFVSYYYTVIVLNNLEHVSSVGDNTGICYNFSITMFSLLCREFSRAL